MKYFVLFLLFFALVFNAYAGNDPLESDANVTNNDRVEPQSAQYRVGYRIKQLTVDGMDGKPARISIAIWYPCNGLPKRSVYNFGSNTVKTDLVVNGKMAKGKFPLIIYSHGASGCGLNSAFLTEELAKNGFVVVAPDYPDAYYQCRIEGEIPFGKRRPAQLLRWIKDIRENQLNKEPKTYRERLSYRPKELLKVIDYILEEAKDQASPLHNSILDNQIGLVGHSFGAWTSVLVAGADQRFYNKDIKAVAVLSSPVNEHVYTVTSSNELANIRIPIIFMYGGEEKKVGRQSDYNYLYEPANEPKYVLEIPGADHFSFSGGMRREYNNIAGFKQDAVRKMITENTIIFFKAHLKNDQQSLKQLPAISAINSI